ncbi:MAG: amidohydrolase family protein [Bacteroidota bacterium]
MKRRNFIQKGLGSLALGGTAFGMGNSMMAGDIFGKTATSPENMDLTDKELPKINLHGHLRWKHDIPARIKIWDEWNVQHFCCLCLNHDHPEVPDLGYFGNDDFLKIKDEYGDRILGFAAAKLTTKGVSSPDDVERFKEQGFVGLKFIVAGYPYDHEIFFPLYEKAQELKMPIVFHTGFLGGDPYKYVDVGRKLGIHVNNMRVNRLDKVARWFPDLQISAAHLGNQDRDEALALTQYYNNFHCDFSGSGGSKLWVRTILKSMLPAAQLETDMSNPLDNPALLWFEKLCFGTDNPEPDVWVPNSQYIMDTMEIPLETRKRFYYDNAARMIGL